MEEIKWIDINEEQPGEEVLAINKQDEVLVGYLYQEDGEWICDGSDISLENVTHWMSLDSLRELKR